MELLVSLYSTAKGSKSHTYMYAYTQEDKITLVKVGVRIRVCVRVSIRVCISVRVSAGVIVRIRVRHLEREPFLLFFKDLHGFGIVNDELFEVTQEQH